MSHDETLAILRNIPWNIPAFEVTVLSQLLTADTPIKPSKLTHLFPLNAQIDYPNAIVESLKDNTPPSTTVVSITREFRETQAKAVAATEDEIASLDAQILALRTRRAELIKKASPEWMKLNACDAVLSVIRRLPMEIVQEIALHARPLQPWPTRRDSPMSLSHVCKDWRNAALSMPQLWSEMYLEVDVNYNALQRILSVNEWFPRAKSCPLSLHLYINDDGAVNDHDMQHFVHALWPMLQNVHKLSIGAYWIFDYLPFFGGKLPNLEVLTLKCMAPDDQETELFMDDEPAALFRFLRFAEKLRHLVLDRPIPGAGLILAAFSWSTLTSLTMKQEMALTAWRNLIFICQALKTASFYLSEDDPVDQNGQIVSHSALEELSLAIVDGEMKLRLRLRLLLPKS
ncbi:unnamed protein product [Cyclocybe aegerita]|uniref:F-box domain-containing protein n=1 Tax=Cyclocybe aegerita TaxID=1973307 RepID=A0A8S0VZJ9_CYCAE|nr:unnamed protein product [Cyclocybe aegerita]